MSHCHSSISSTSLLGCFFRKSLIALCEIQSANKHTCDMFYLYDKGEMGKKFVRKLVVKTNTYSNVPPKVSGEFEVFPPQDSMSFEHEAGHMTWQILLSDTACCLMERTSARVLGSWILRHYIFIAPLPSLRSQYNDI